MTRSSPRPIALASLLTLHGIAILCGPAIHRRERHAWPVVAHAGTGWAAPSTQVGPSHADCPICHFLAQGHLVAARSQFVPFGSVVPAYLGREPREVAIALVREPRPRAPPQS